MGSPSPVKGSKRLNSIASNLSGSISSLSKSIALDHVVRSSKVNTSTIPNDSDVHEDKLGV